MNSHLHLFFLVAALLSNLLTAPAHVRAEQIRILRPDGSIESCDSALTAQPNGRMAYQRQELFSTWYMAVDAGSSKKMIAGNPKNGERKILSFVDYDGETQSWPNLLLDQKAPDTAQSYYGRLSVGKASTEFMLFDINAPDLSNLIDQNFALTWAMYGQNGTVAPKEIEEFKATEAQLDPRRKIIFTSQTGTGEVVSVIRVYDGSPYPVFYLGADYPPFDDSKPLGNYRLPLERRYEDLNFREANHYIYEPGRQAISPTVPDAFYHQWSSMARFFTSRFGKNSTAPEEFKDGRVYVELTGKHIRTYMAARAKNGLAFKVFAASIAGEKMTRLDATLTLPELEALIESKWRIKFEAEGRPFDAREVRKNTQDKFILYKDMYDFVMDFHALWDQYDI